MTLIDAGLPGSAAAVISFMAALGFAPNALQRVLLTHRHLDHAGGAAGLRELTGARVYAHVLDVEQSPEGAFIRGAPMAIAVDAVLSDDAVVHHDLGVIHCGGHTSGSVCYYLRPARALFLGDMAVNNVDRLSRPLPLSNEDSQAYEEALERLARIPAESGFFGHGPPLVHGLQDALVALRQRPPSPAWRAALRYAIRRLRRPRLTD